MKYVQAFCLQKYMEWVLSWIYEKNSFRTYQLCVDVLLIALVRYIFTLFVLHSLAHYLAGHRNKEILLLNVIVLFTGFLYYLFLITKINMDLHFMWKAQAFLIPNCLLYPLSYLCGGTVILLLFTLCSNIDTFFWFFIYIAAKDLLCIFSIYSF